MSPGTISVLQLPVELNPSLQNHLLLSRWWSDVIGLCYICNIFLPQKDYFSDVFDIP